MGGRISVKKATAKLDADEPVTDVPALRAIINRDVQVVSEETYERLARIIVLCHRNADIFEELRPDLDDAGVVLLVRGGAHLLVMCICHVALMHKAHMPEMIQHPQELMACYEATVEDSSDFNTMLTSQFIKFIAIHHMYTEFTKVMLKDSSFLAKVDAESAVQLLYFLVFMPHSQGVVVPSKFPEDLMRYAVSAVAGLAPEKRASMIEAADAEFASGRIDVCLFAHVALDVPVPKNVLDQVLSNSFHMQIRHGALGTITLVAFVFGKRTLSELDLPAHPMLDNEGLTIALTAMTGILAPLMVALEGTFELKARFVE